MNIPGRADAHGLMLFLKQLTQKLKAKEKFQTENAGDVDGGGTRWCQGWREQLRSPKIHFVSDTLHPSSTEVCSELCVSNWLHAAFMHTAHVKLQEASLCFFFSLSSSLEVSFQHRASSDLAFLLSIVSKRVFNALSKVPKWTFFIPLACTLHVTSCDSFSRGL